VIQRMIREVGGGSSYPTLTKLNYSDWALLMMVKLKVRGLWNAVESGGDDVQEDLIALDALLSVVPSEMAATMASKKSAKEAWDAIKTLRIGDDRVRASMAQQLLQKFDVATFQEGESVEDFLMRLSGMAQHLATFGDPLDEPKVVTKFLCNVPRKYRQVVVSTIHYLMSPPSHWPT
jgi:hypothetical protein